MTNLIVGRYELIAKQHRQVLQDEEARHKALKDAEDARHDEVLSDEDARVYAQVEFELTNLFVNMVQRCKARGFKKKEDRYLWLYGRKFEDTWIDVNDADQKDVRVREYFDSLLDAFDGDKAKLLKLYTKLLDQYFPIKRTDRTWNPVLRRVPFKPKRKSDPRTMTYTVYHYYHHI